MCHVAPILLLVRGERMITGVGLICVFVLDADEAREFYTVKLGLEVGMDMVRDGFRWLTVHSPRQPQLPIMLVDPSAAVMDTETAEQIKSLVATGYLGPGALTTDDCVATFHELKARGVEFVEEPEERFYGIDAGFRVPFGNHWRLTQPKLVPPSG
jgi:catechol 2,3-dioxygenase-like lactoylglutathione lyase family enzyme